ncbi:hypothetical protein I204_05143 [Kwoniella mangroviensis CBS 8886]|nr:hypothetical protein I204_05143 [Kwoniella mangroviensis CBS 8886]
MLYVLLQYDLDDIQYFTPYHQSSCTLRTATTLPIGETFTPIVVIPVSKPDEGIFTPQHLRPLIESYLQQDDVLTQSFFNTVLLHPEDRSTKFDIDISALVYLMREMDAKILILDESLKINLPSPGTVLPSLSVHTVPSGCLSDKTAGPYLARSQLFGNEIDLFPVYRLYADYYRTFVSGVYPLNDGLGTYRVLGKVDEFGNQMIPVPSRLYTIDSEKSLAGERVGVKDIYDIKGLPTTAGSRTYTAWRGTANTTASSMVKLQNEGAEIVGKAKTVAYASSGMVVSLGLVRYPFSPRGDLYQSCGSSSSGPACAMAAYHWLDFTVGSDTAGSVRGPAAVAGLYGNKPTQGIINLDGLVQVLKWTDTPGIFTRSPAKFKKILDAWYSDSQADRRHNHLPKTLLVPSDDFPDMPENIRSIVVKTLRVIENTLGMKVEMINQTATHPHKHPDDGGFMTVEMFKKTIFAWQSRYLGQTILKWYGSQNEGRFPPVGTTFHDRWKAMEDDRGQTKILTK